MALNIKDAETDRLAREVAAAAGESITVAVRVALEERAQRLRRRQSRSDARAVIQEIIDAGRAERDLDPRTNEEIIGYDEHGLPS